MQDVQKHTVSQRLALDSVQSSNLSWKKFPTRCGQRRSRRDFWIQGGTLRVLDWPRITMRSDSDVGKEEPMQQEPSCHSGLKRSPADDEATRRANAEAEKAWRACSGT